MTPNLRACAAAAGRAEAVRALVRRHAPSSEPAPSAGLEVALRLPLSAAAGLADLLDEIDARRRGSLPLHTPSPFPFL